jgi:hypothetical protein
MNTSTLAGFALVLGEDGNLYLEFTNRNNKDIDKLFSDEDWRSVNSCINTVRRSMNEIEHNISQEINAISFYEG